MRRTARRPTPPRPGAASEATIDGDAVKKCVFIHTNHRQWIGAVVSAYSLRRNSAHADDFEVEFIHTKDHPFLWEKEGQEFLRGGTSRVWHMEDLQSFTPLRFMPPQLMGYEGRAIVIDPDVFAVGDVYELLTRDMEGKGVMGRRRSQRDDRELDVATSVMLMDCAKLRHWDCPAMFDALFRFERDYKDWMSLEVRGARQHRLLRPRVERLRPADRAHQAPAQHQAQDAAVEDRAAGRLHAGRQVQGVSRRWLI